MGVEQSPGISRDRGPDPVTTGLIALVLGAALIAALGCAAKIGPGDRGWLEWDICGFEGGVAAELTVLAMTARLGCTNPAAVEPEPEP